MATDTVLRLLAPLDRVSAAVVVAHADGWRLREIADVLGVSESRVSQIRTAALSRLTTETAPTASR